MKKNLNLSTKNIIILSILIINFNAYASDQYKKCLDKVLENSETSKGPDFYYAAIDKCGFKKYSLESCNQLYYELYGNCLKNYHGGFSSADEGYFALFKNFKKKELEEVCEKKIKINRKKFGEQFCEGK